MRFAILFLALASTWSFAGNVDRRVQISTDIFEDRMASRDSIPLWVLREARCIASVRMVRAGFLFGGEGSTGLVSCRTASGEWSTPSFINIGGPSIGLQIGVQFADVVLVFVSDYSRSMLLGPELKLAGDFSVAVGPVGEGAGIGHIGRAHVLSYMTTRGLFAGLTLTGQIMAHGPKRNRKVYGPGISGARILATPASRSPEVVMPYPQALSRYIP